MDPKTVVALGFLVLSCTFMITLIKSLFAILKYTWVKDGSDWKNILGILKVPLITVVLIIIFIFYIIPIIDK